MKTLPTSALASIIAFASVSPAISKEISVDTYVRANLRVVPQKDLQVGKPGKITVMFTQDVNDKNFTELTDYADVPVFPPIDGIEFTGTPALSTDKSEITNNSGKHTLTVYWRNFRYPVVPRKEGEYTVDNVTFQFHGHTIKADPVTFTVLPDEKKLELHPDLRRNWLKAPAKTMSWYVNDVKFKPDGEEIFIPSVKVIRDAEGEVERVEYGMVDYEYIYHQNGLLYTQQVKDKNGHIQDQEVYTYYDILEPATTTYYHWYGLGPDEEPECYMVKYYKYEWDDHGNWIKRIAAVEDYDSLPESTKKRLIGEDRVWTETRTFTY